jgi:hypothetical protein
MTATQDACSHINSIAANDMDNAITSLSTGTARQILEFDLTMHHIRLAHLAETFLSTLGIAGCATPANVHHHTVTRSADQMS